MALADRTYMRDEYHPPRMATYLIAGLIIAFVIQSLFFFYGDFDSFRFFGLTAAGLREGKIWQGFRRAIAGRPS